MATGTFAVKVRSPDDAALARAACRGAVAAAADEELAPCRTSADLAPVAQAGMAQMLKGGVIMDVINVEQARIAEEAGEPPCVGRAATAPVAAWQWLL